MQNERVAPEDALLNPKGQITGKPPLLPSVILGVSDPGCTLRYLLGTQVLRLGIVKSQISPPHTHTHAYLLQKGNRTISIYEYKFLAL